MIGPGLGLTLSPAQAAGTARAVAPMDSQAPSDGNYVPLPQAPLVDTRSGLGLPSNPIAGGTTYGVVVAGKSGVPSADTVSAVALSVTTTNSTTSSQLTVYPAGQTTRPGTATTISAAGENRQNSAYIALGTDGKIWIYIDRGSTDLVIAVTGYFSKAQTGASFTTVSQTRLVDTRNGTGVPQAKIPAGGSVTFSVASAGVPTTAASLAFNFTVLSPNNGYLNAGPATGSSTLYTGVSFAGGSDLISNGAFVQMNPARTIKVINNASAPIDVVVDIFGYFGAASAGGGFHADQARVYDSLTTPPNPIPAGGTVYVKLLGQGGIPSHLVGAVAVTLTTTAQTSSGFLRTYDPDNAEPSVGSSLNYQPGDVISNSAIVQPSLPGTGAHAGTVAIHNISTGTIRLVVDVQGWFSPYYDQDPGTTNPGGPGKRSFEQFTTFGIDDKTVLHLNEASGNGWLSNADVNIAGLGLNLTLGRHYNSRDNGASGAFGAGWSLDDADTKLVADGSGNEMLYGPTGYQVQFTKNGSTFTSPNAINADLTLDTNASPNRYKLTFHKSAQVWYFTLAGQLTSQQDRAANPNMILFHYNGSGQLTSITDTRGRTITLTWTSGKVTQIADPTGRQWTYGYTGGQLTSYTDPTGSVTTYGYDASGNLKTIIDGTGAETLLTTIANGRISAIRQYSDPSTWGETDVDYNNGRTEISDPDGNTSTYLFNGKGEITDAFDAAGDNRTITYNDNSDVIFFTPASGEAGGMQVAGGYDSQNRLTSLTLPTTAHANGTYAAPTNPYAPSSTTSSQGNTTNYTYDGQGQLQGTSNVVNGATVTTASPRNNDGTVQYKQDGLGNRTTYGYDGVGQLTSVSYPGPRQPTTYTYDSLSRIATRTDGDGTVFHYLYDADDRLLHVDDSGADHEVVFTYNNAGDLTQRVDSSGTETTTFDGVNRITAQTLAKGGTVSATYDAVGNLLTMTDAGGTTTYTYNDNNQVATLTDPNGATTTFAYTPDGERKSITWGDGSTQATTYDASGRVHEITGKLANGTTVTDRTYSYDKSGTDQGLRQSVTDNNGVKTSYVYDALDRLTSATVTSGGTTQHTYTYDYDAAGNRTHATVDGTTLTEAYNASDELCWASAGNLTPSCSSPPPAPDETFTYDNDGNLTQVARASGNTNYAYNGYGQLVSQGPLTFSYGGTSQDERYTSADSSTGGQAYVFSQSLLGLTTRSNTTNGDTTSFTRDTSGQLTATSTGAVGSDYLTDGLGSVIATVNNAGTAVTQTYAYDPWGTLTNSSGTDTNPYRYAGEYQDQPTGTYAVGARTLNTTFAVWTQPDPSGRDSNPYAYAGDDPINATDPTGLFSIGDGLEIAAIGLSVGAAVATGGTSLALTAAAVGFDAAGGYDNGDSGSEIAANAAADAVPGGVGSLAEHAGVEGAGLVAANAVGVAQGAGLYLGEHYGE